MKIGIAFGLFYFVLPEYSTEMWTRAFVSYDNNDNADVCVPLISTQKVRASF